MTAAEAARLMNSYARAHAGGAFASPTAAELNRHGWLEWPGVVATVARSPRASTRTDWTGRPFTLPPCCSIASFIARAPDAAAPDDLAAVDAAHVYADDDVLSAFYAAHGFRRYATRVSSSSEVITTWTAKGLLPARPEHPADRPTASVVPFTVERDALAEMRAELDQVQRWHDDYPFYSDGSWGAVNLRGYWDDPLLGVKPAEMPRKWQREHPEALRAPVRWTSITPRLPTMRSVTEALAAYLGADALQRVRLMKMAAKPGGGRLARHSDVTDRQAGTRDGQVARFHLPVVSHPDITMTVWELDGTQRDVHLAPGTVWYLDQRKPHAVTNPTKVDRVHLVVDVICNEAVRERLEAIT